MGDAMSGVGIGVIGIVLGVIMLMFRKPFARSAMRQQNEVFGFRFGEREVGISEFIILLVAIFFVVFGLLSLLGILEVRLS